MDSIKGVVNAQDEFTEEFRSGGLGIYSFEQFADWLEEKYGVLWNFREPLEDITVIDPVKYTLFLLKWP